MSQRRVCFLMQAFLRRVPRAGVVVQLVTVFFQSRCIFGPPLTNTPLMSQRRALMLACSGVVHLSYCCLTACL